MTEIVFYARGIPKPQPRPRASVVNGEIHMRSGASKDVLAFRESVAWAARDAYEGRPLTGPVSCDIDILFKRPRSMYRKSKPMPRVRHVARPDRDNVEKAILDSLTGILWQDDSQVCDGRTRKFYASGSERPGCLVRVRTLDLVYEPQPKLFA